MNLKNPEKRFYFKIILYIGIISIIIFGIMWLIGSIKIKENNYRDKHNSIVIQYDVKIKQKDSINKILIKKQEKLEIQIDSLERIKTGINIDYGKKIKNVYDASAIEHAIWMDTVLEKLNNNKK